MSLLPATHLLRSGLQRSGYFSTPSTPEATVRSFVDKLRPYTTDKKLIRIGAGADGGYLVPDDLTGIEYCFSPGVNRTATFEEDILRRGIKSYLADASVDGPPASLRDYVFDKKFLGSYNDETYMTLTSWMERYLPAHRGDLLLQMDIEGGEYPVLIESPRETLRRFRIILIEFHHLEQLLNRAMFPLLAEAFHKLLLDFTLVHLHPNNAGGVNRLGSVLLPNMLEMTFLRNDRIAERKPSVSFPHPLDQRNLSTQDDLVLPDCWYR